MLMVADDDTRGGERACYLEICWSCDKMVTITDEKCPDCGASLQV